MNGAWAFDLGLDVIAAAVVVVVIVVVVIVEVVVVAKTVVEGKIKLPIRTINKLNRKANK